MSTEITIEKRSKKEFECVLGPKLILIAEKPLSRDKVEILDSPVATQYLSECFNSKFKSTETHVTYVKDENDYEFVRGIFINILGKYLAQGKLDVKNLIVGFIGQKAFDAFKEDWSKNTDKSFCTFYVNEDYKLLKIFAPWLSKEDVYIPYTILPDIDGNLSGIAQQLNDVKQIEMVKESPYSDTQSVTRKFQIITELYKEGSLKFFRFNAKVNTQTKRLEYFSVYDKYNNKELLYYPKSEQCQHDTKEQKRALYDAMTETLTTVPVHGDNIKDTISVFPFADKITVLSQDDLDQKPDNRSSFVFTGDSKSPNGPKSEWYHKWYQNAYLPYIKANMTPSQINMETYNNACKYEWVYDIEVFKEDWLFVAKSIDRKNKIVCWNDSKSLMKWIANKILIGFNNAAYDNPVIKHAMSYPYLVPGSPTVKEFSDNLIFGDETRNEFYEFAADSEVKSRNIPNFLSWDISFHMPFDIRRNSLKKLTMSVLDRKNYDSAVSFDIDRALTKLEREEVERYCEMDVDNTLDLFLPDPEDVKKKAENPKYKMREFAQESYDIRWNLIVEYKMKAKTLINKAASFAGKLLCGEEAKPNPKNTYKIVDGKKQYYKIPDLAYTELAGTPLLQFYIDNQSNPEYITQKFEYHMGGDDEGHLYQFGFGGLHQALLKYGSTNLVNMDVASLYPSLLVNYGLMSRGAAKNPDSYEQVYHTRLQAKKEGKTLLNLGLKLILNGSIGAMLSKFNPLHDTWSNSTICTYGQLLLFILCKRLYEAGFNIVQTNTDGIMIERQDNVDFMPIAEKWMKETKLILEFDEIDVLQQNNVNNYYCLFSNGKVKSKGFYLSNEKFGKATSKILCNLVTGKPPLEGTVAKDYVIFKRHGIGEIYDGVTRQKLDGRSLAFVVGKPDDKRTQSYYSRSRNEREVVKKDEKGKAILDENGNQQTEIINSESKITGFTDHMLLIDDINSLTLDEINTQEYINFAKNLLDRVEDFGPYYDTGFVKVEEPAYLQALNPLKDNTDLYPTKAGVVCQNFLFECDYTTKEEQEEIIESCKDKLYRVVWSGNKSYHCVVRIDKPVTSTTYKKVWYYLRNKLGFTGADEQCAVASKLTRTPGQINPKTGNEQTLYLYDKNILSCDEILEDLPKVKEELKKPTQYKGKVTIEALKRHIKRLDWSDGNRFASCQKLSPLLISQVSMKELLEMIPINLQRDHKRVIQAKYFYAEKYKDEFDEVKGNNE